MNSAQIKEGSGGAPHKECDNSLGPAIRVQRVALVAVTIQLVIPRNPALSPDFVIAREGTDLRH